MMTFGEMCVKVAEREMARVNPPTAVDVAVYFQNCVRGGKILGIKKGNHCAAFASWCAAQTLLEMGVDSPPNLPHQYRAGAKELMCDSIASATWHEKSEVLAGVWLPEKGDLAIYDRSIPGRPETAWWGHVDRVMSVDGSHYQNIGANEAPNPTGINATRIEWTPFNHSRLLGFIAYPRENSQSPKHLLKSWQIDYLKGLVALTTQQMLDEVRAEADFEADWKARTANA